MIFHFDSVVLRKPEPKDIEDLYKQKNDPEVADLLVGFSAGYSRSDIADWIEYHRSRKDEIIWVIANSEYDRCIGHVGLYQIDHRIRSAEFGIMIGDKAFWGRKLGPQITRFVIKYAFSMLNLNRIHLTVLNTNKRALNLYRTLGFHEEGLMRQAQFKNGSYIDIVIMSLLREEFDGVSG